MDSNSLKKNSKNKNWPKLQGYKLQFSENNIWHVFKKKKTQCWIKKMTQV